MRGVVVFLGPNGLGRWQRRELALALDRQTREATFPVIPVLLPASEAGDYSGFLLLNTYADLRGGLNDPGTLDAIMRAVRSPATGEEARTILPPEAAAICPYRGLKVFREEDAPLFFGRDRLVDDPEQGLLHKVLTCPLVTVVGASGSGKSSVVQAGLLPRLRREPPSRGTWDVVAFRPGKYPFHNLAIALEAVRNPEASDAARETDAAALVKGWSSGNVPFDWSLGRAREALRVDWLLVVVDQFEELITLTPKEDCLPFLSRLLAATGAGSGFTILLTLRADYYGRAIGLDRGLCDGIQRGLVNVGAMTRDERRAAIAGPARRVGLEFESGLVERLLDDVGDEPGNLPLLEFALTELWERRAARRLTNAAYEALGRVAGAIGRRAETVFEKLTEEQQAAAQRLFGRLVRVTDIDEEGRDTRQRVRLSDLDETSRSAVEPFVAGRLLVTARASGPSVAEASQDNGPAPSASDDPTTVEVAHEALIRTWDRLQGWVKEDRTFLLWRQRLGFQIAEWERSGRDEGMLLRGALLKEAEDFKSRWDELNDRERDFLTWTETDLYPINILEKDAPVLVRFCDHSDTRSRWLRALALTRGVNEAVANARVIEEPSERSEARARWPRPWPRPAWPTRPRARRSRRRTRRSRSSILGSDRKRLRGGRGPGQGRPDRPGEGRGAPDRGSLGSIASACAVAEALAKAGLTDQAKGAALQIEEPWDRSQARCAVAEALAEAGLADQAEGRGSRSSILGSDRKRCAVAEALAEAGLTDQAKARGAPDRVSSGAIASAARGGRGPGQGRPGRPGQGAALQAKGAGSGSRSLGSDRKRCARWPRPWPRPA